MTLAQGQILLGRVNLLRSKKKELEQKLNNCEQQKTVAKTRLDFQIENGRKERFAEYMMEYDREIDEIEEKTASILEQIKLLDRRLCQSPRGILDKLKTRMAKAKKIVEMSHKNADLVGLKAAYQQLFHAVIATACYKTGCLVLHFVLGDELPPSVTDGGKGRYRERLVGAGGLEPPVLRL